MDRDTYNQEILAEAIALRVTGRIPAQGELADQVALAELMGQTGAPGPTDRTTDNLRAALIAANLRTDADLPAAPKSRHRATTALETGPDGFATVSVTEGGDGPHWPKVDTHTWGAFAYLAIEAGGYRDLEVVNPCNGERMWVADAMGELTDEGEDTVEVSPYDALRKLIDAMERHQFLG